MVLDREGNFTDFGAFDFHAYSNADEYLRQAADQQLRSLGATNPRPSEYRASWALVVYKGSHEGVDWVRFAEAPRMQGPTEIGVKIPTPLHTYGCA